MDKYHKNKYIKLVVLIVFALALGGYIYSVQYRQKDPKEQVMYPVFKDFKKDDINKIYINYQKEEINLVKNEDAWGVLYDNGKNFPAKDIYLSMIFENIVDIEEGEIASKNIENLQDFNLTEDSAVIVKMKDKDDNIIYDFLIGKFGARYDTSYFKFADDDKVLLVAKNLNSYFNRGDETNWRERRLFIEKKKEDLKNLQVSYSSEGVQENTDSEKAEQEYNLWQQDNKWFLDSEFNQSAKQDKVEEIMSVLFSLNAKDFVLEEIDLNQKGLNQENAFLKITLNYNDDSQEILLIGQKQDDDSYLARFLARSEVIYLLPKNVEQLKVNINDLQQ